MEVAWKWGLIAPRDKLKITNMADDQVDLTPEDIPSVSFSEEERKIDRCLSKVLVNAAV